jgi:signal peptidase II
MTRILLFLSLPLYLLDQATKFWVLRRFAEPERFDLEEAITVIPDFFWIHRTHNTGVAFGLFNGTEGANIFFAAVALLALSIIGWLCWKGAFPTWTGRSAVGLLVAGILGNLTDRLLHGYVIDFLRFDLKFMVWPSFNVADSCICVAAVLLAHSAFESPGAAKTARAG